MADTRFKAENGLLVVGNPATTNSSFEHVVNMSANLYVRGDYFFVGGDFVIQGDQIITGQSLYDVDILPVTETGRAIGNSTNRFDVNARNITVTGNLFPTSNTLLLGNNTSRWNVHTTSINATGPVTITNSVSITGTLTVNNVSTFSNTSANVLFIASNGNIGIANSTPAHKLSVSGTTNFSGAVNVNSTLAVQSNATTNGYLLSTHAAVFGYAKSISTATKTVVDAYPKVLGNFSKNYVTIYVSNSVGTFSHAAEVSTVQSASFCYFTVYGEIYNLKLGTFDADFNGDNVEIYFTPTTANSSYPFTVKSIRNQILA